MRTEAIAATLRKTELFSGLSDDTVTRIAERTVPRRYGKGQPVVLEGDAGESMFVVAEGGLKLTVLSPDGDEMVLTTFGPGDSFGELSMLDGGRRSASAYATEPSTLLALTRSTVLDLVAEDRALADRLFARLGGLVRRLTGQAADLVFLDLDGRVAKALSDLAARHGEPSGEEIVVDLSLTQSDLAQMVGGSRQSVNQILKAFEGDGLVSMRRRRIVVHDLEALERRARSVG